jgi:hypothetical protein
MDHPFTATSRQATDAQYALRIQDLAVPHHRLARPARVAG